MNALTMFDLMQPNDTFVYFCGFKGIAFVIQYMEISKKRGTPKSSMFVGFSTISHPFWGILIYRNLHIPTSLQRPRKAVGSIQWHSFQPSNRIRFVRCSTVRTWLAATPVFFLPSVVVLSEIHRRRLGGRAGRMNPGQGPNTTYLGNSMINQNDALRPDWNDG